MLRSGAFTKHQPEKLALSLIKETRIKYRLEPWKQQLQVISGFTAEEIKTVEKTDILKPLSVLSTNNGIVRTKEKPLSVSQNSTSASLQNTTLVV